MPTTIDSNGIAWFVGSGAQGVISQSRDEATDDRWSGNVTGLRQGFEATFIGRSHGTNSSSHFAMKQGGGNHSGSGASSQRWYDTGIRVGGEIQLQWEGPHPNNHDFSLPANKQFISNIGVGLENNWIGLKWCVRTVTNNSTPANGGVRVRMWVNTSISATGVPNNSAWRLCFDFIDGVDATVISPQTYAMPDEMDLEVRRSDTDSHDVYAGGLHWRRLTAADLAADLPGSNPNPPPPPPPPQGNNIDQFGVKMIYPTKVIDGEQANTWFQDNNPEFDGRVVSDLEVISRVGDYFVASPEPQGDVYIKIINDFDPFIECQVNYSQLASQGFVSDPGDWKNVEITIFIYPQDIETNTADPNAVQFALEARASDDSGNQVCCSDYRYAGVLLLPATGEFAGKVRLNKRLINNNRLENLSQSVKTNFFRSWTGMKLIVYNTTGPNNEQWVTVELWLCPSDSATDKSTNWTKVYSFIDKGNNWGVGGDACAGAIGQAITWGTSFVSMRYELEPEIRWKHWSVREIDVNGSFPGDPPGPPDPPCEEEENPPPPPPPEQGGSTLPVYRFLSWGDNDTTSDATAVLDRMFLETNVSQYLFAGDGPYSTDSNEWIDMMSTYFNTPALKGMLMLAQGNHEHPESESQQSEDQIEQWFPGLHNANEGLEWLQQKKVGNVYIIVMNSQDPNIDEQGSAQYLYVQNALNTAKQLRTAGQIDWIVTMVHKSWFNLLGTNPAYVTARHAYTAMFRDAQVDFMFHGHNHSYAIWRPIVAIPGNDENTAAQHVFTILGDGRYDLSKDHGAFYIINGNGGHEINSWGENPADFPNILYANDVVFGYSVLDIQGKQATLRAKNAAGAVLFTVNATRGTDATTNPPPPNPDPDPCEPPPPPPPPESVFNDLILVYNINSDSDGCICNDPGFTPPPPGQEPCPTGQHRDPVSGLCVPDIIVPPPPPGGPGSGGENQAIYDIGFQSGNPDDLRMASESGDDHMYLKVGAEITGTSSPLYNRNIKRIEWPLRKSGNPTGNATVVIRKGQDNSIAKTLGTIDVTDLTNTTEYKAVENTADTYNTVVGDRILIEYSGGDDNDYVIAWAVNGVSNSTRLTKQDNTMDDDEYRTRDQEASFRAFV